MKLGHYMTFARFVLGDGVWRSPTELTTVYQ